MLKSGFVAVFIVTATHQVISTAPYVVFESKKACEDDTAQLRRTADKLTIKCLPGTVYGPKRLSDE